MPKTMGYEPTCEMRLTARGRFVMYAGLFAVAVAIGWNLDELRLLGWWT